MSMHSADLDEDAIFNVCARISRKTVGHDANAKSTNVEGSGIMVGRQDVGMYNMNNEDLSAVYKTTVFQV